MTRDELENMLNELIFQSYQSALNKEGAATRANEIKAKIMHEYEEVDEYARGSDGCGSG